MKTTIAADQRDLIRDGIRESSQRGRTSRRVVKVKNARLFFAEDRPHARAAPVFDFWDELKRCVNPYGLTVKQKSAGGRGANLILPIKQGATVSEMATLQNSNFKPSMSALGQKRTFSEVCAIRFTPESGHRLSVSACPLCAKSRHRRKTCDD
jgi:hypothetical protein